MDALNDALIYGDPLPPSAPLEMAPQNLRSAKQRRRLKFKLGVAIVRFYVISGAGALTAFAAIEMLAVLDVAGLTALEAMVLVLFIALFAWIALAFTSATAGFVALMTNRQGNIDATGPLPRLHRRTAILLPTYNEDPARIAAALQAIDESLRRIGAGSAFDFFILSDTTDPDIWIAEERAFLALRERTNGHHRIFYRRRPYNVERKSGNIAEWVIRFGGSYEHMLVLDADSVMTADTIVRITAAMESDDDIGLIQTLPVLVGGRTLFARMQQFAGRIYGPLIARGIATWHGSEGNYWGHNAIIRTRAFAESAGLPRLKGRMPFGGHILSHDFVEAALLRRAGWAVCMAPALTGSYEEGPPSLTDLAVRDRRWCQGNLQHAAVLPARGLHWISRLHLLMGIGSYITAPMWFAFLCIGILISLQARFVRPEYFPAGATLFPEWPAQDPVRAMWVFVGTMGLLIAPKVLAWIATATHAATRRSCGGAFRLLVGLVVETLLAGLLAPVNMLSQSAAVVSVLAGRDGGWQPQRRDDGTYPPMQVIHRYAPHTALGLALAAISYAVSPSLFLWMLPVVGGLALTIPLVLLSASVGAGAALARRSILRTPEEFAPPLELVRAASFRHQMAKEAGRESDAVALLSGNPPLLRAHLRMLPPPRRPRRDPIDIPLTVGLAKIAEARTLSEAAGALNRIEKLAVLGNADALDRLFALPNSADQDRPEQTPSATG